MAYDVLPVFLFQSVQHQQSFSRSFLHLWMHPSVSRTDFSSSCVHSAHLIQQPKEFWRWSNVRVEEERLNSLSLCLCLNCANWIINNKTKFAKLNLLEEKTLHQERSWDGSTFQICFHISFMTIRCVTWFHCNKPSLKWFLTGANITICATISMSHIWVWSLEHIDISSVFSVICRSFTIIHHHMQPLRNSWQLI